jgi:hypothetical protein
MKKDIQDNHPGYPSSILTILIQICLNPDSQDLRIYPDFSLQLVTGLCPVMPLRRLCLLQYEAEPPPMRYGAEPRNESCRVGTCFSVPTALLSELGLSEPGFSGFTD